MGVYVLQDCKLFVAQYDVSGDVNEGELGFGVDLKDRTTFGSGGARQRKGGLKNVGLRLRGFTNPGTGLSDEGLFTAIGENDKVVSVAPETGADGETLFGFLANLADYAPGASVGEMFGFSCNAQGSDGNGLVRGYVMAPKAARTVTGTGTARNLGLVGSGQKLYAWLHVFAKAGTTPTLDVVIESDDGSGFASPVTRITFGQKTGESSEWATPVAGPIATDTWWRAKWTIGGTGGPSFTFAVGLAIQ